MFPRKHVVVVLNFCPRLALVLVSVLSRCVLSFLCPAGVTIRKVPKQKNGHEEKKNLGGKKKLRDRGGHGGSLPSRLLLTGKGRTCPEITGRRKEGKEETLRQTGNQPDSQTEWRGGGGAETEVKARRPRNRRERGRRKDRERARERADKREREGGGGDRYSENRREERSTDVGFESPQVPRPRGVGVPRGSVPHRRHLLLLHPRLRLRRRTQRQHTEGVPKREFACLRKDVVLLLNLNVCACLAPGGARKTNIGRVATQDGGGEVVGSLSPAH